MVPGKAIADMVRPHLSSWEKKAVSVTATAIAKEVGLDRRSTRRFFDHVRGGRNDCVFDD